MSCTSAFLSLIDRRKGGEPSVSQSRGSISQSLCNHDLQADADKRCKGDYGSRRTSLQRGLGISPLRRRMNISV